MDSQSEVFANLDIFPYSSGKSNDGIVGCTETFQHQNWEIITCIDPSTLEPIATYSKPPLDVIKKGISDAYEASKIWRDVPAPVRGQIVRQMRDKLETRKNALAHLLSIEVGKTLNESLGEIQEYIDICDYALGLSRSFSGSIFPSERRETMLLEYWNPLGVVGVISAFNFPAAVYGWNSAISLVCGNSVVWKPSETATLIAIAVSKIISSVLRDNSIPEAVCCMIAGDGSAGKTLSESEQIALVSFTGSTNIGRMVSQSVSNRFGRTILELGGNNAIIVMADADLELATRSILFAAIGTTGQRCTTLRRLFIHESIFSELISRLETAYARIIIGSPLENAPGEIRCGPLHTKAAFEMYHHIVEERIPSEGGQIVVKGGKSAKDLKGYFVQPVIVKISQEASLLQEESFVPILYAVAFQTFEDAVRLNNSVKQGLSSSLFTQSPDLIFKWLSHEGSDCGIVNVNSPTTGAEIGAAFGGNKSTGWGRESGSNSWQGYMSRHSAVISYGRSMQLAQGVRFD